MDEATQIRFTTFFETKKVMAEPTFTHLNKSQKGVLPVHKIRCNNEEYNILPEKVAIGKGCKLDLTFGCMG